MALKQNLVTFEWTIWYHGGLVTVDVDANEMGEPVACRVADSAEPISVDYFKLCLGDYAEVFAKVATRRQARVRKLAGISTQ